MRWPTGRVDEAGVLGDYVEAVAHGLNRWAETIQDRGLDGLLDDLRSFGRRRPGLFLAGALAAGVIAGRFGRNAAQELRDDGWTSDRTGSSAPFPTGSSTGAAGHDVTAWRTTDGLADVGSSDEPVSGGVGSSDEPVSGGGETQRSGTGPGDQTSDRSGDHDVIVGYASDDSSVVVRPGGTTADETPADRPIAPPRDAEDVERRPIDIDQERTR